MPENVKLDDGNFSRGPTAGNIYSIQRTNNQLVQVLEGNGSLVASFPLINSQLRNDVKELHFDGTHFWSLEDLPSDLGSVIKKWRLNPLPTSAFPLSSPSTLKWQDEVTIFNTNSLKVTSSAFCVEHFHLKFVGSSPAGSSQIVVDDASRINAGSILYLGPSTEGSSTNQEESVIVTGKSGNTVFISGTLKSSYSGNNPISLTLALWLFNDNGFTGSEDVAGSLIRIGYPAKTITRAITGAEYSKVAASDFDSNDIYFVRTDQIIRFDVDQNPFSLLSSMESNLRKSDKISSIEVFDMISEDSQNRHLKLQLEELDESTVPFVDVSYSNGKYNFQQQTTIPLVNSIALSFDDRFTRTSASSDTVKVTTKVRDQFNFPVASISINYSATIFPTFVGTPGTFSPTSSGTNADGVSETTYFPSATVEPILVNVKATDPALPNLSTESPVSQVGQFKQDDTFSTPVQQRKDSIDVSTTPIEQKGSFKTGATTSKPVQQTPDLVFPPTDQDFDGTMEQKGLAKTSAAANGPVELLDFDLSDDEMIHLVDFTQTYKPMEQQDPGAPFPSSPANPPDIADSIITITQNNFVISIFPPCNSTKNPVDTAIVWRILDFGSPYNISSIIFTVDGRVVQDTAEFEAIAITNGIQITYNSAEPYDFDGEITVYLQVEDTDSPVNTIFSKCTWRTVPDTKAPFFQDLTPVCNDTNVDSFASIEFDVIDIGFGVDQSSIKLSVEGLQVCNGIVFTPISVTSGTGFHVAYTHPDDPFRYGSQVTIGIEASDIADPPNSTLFVCCFTIESSIGPTFVNFSPDQCDSFVDPDTGLTFEIYGVEHGVDISTLEVRVDLKLRKVFVRPRLLRSS